MQAPCCAPLAAIHALTFSAHPLAIGPSGGCPSHPLALSGGKVERGRCSSCCAVLPKRLRQRDSPLRSKAGNSVSALPRDISARHRPIGDGTRRCIEGFGYGPCPPKGFDNLFGHAPLSQIVTSEATLNSHSLCVATHGRMAQSVSMESQDKNGGPNHLRAWRNFRNLSQQELAERVGTSANMIGYLECGERGLSAKWLRKLADALDTSPGMILDHDPNDLDNDILEIWATASNRQKRQISEIAKTLLRNGTDG